MDDPNFDPRSFERRWRERFAEFASLREDDAGIAGWSVSGLETRMRFFRSRWRAMPAGSACLDVGCGAATYTRWLAEQGQDVIGLDYSHPALIKARARTPTHIPLCVGDATELPFPDRTFDAVLCFGVLQAMATSAPVVRELGRVLKPGGTLWIDALNHAAVTARAERLRLKMKGKGVHLRYELPQRLRQDLADAGFGAIVRHWLPIVPSRVRGLQPIFESAPIRAAFHAWPWVGSALSHAFVFEALRDMR